MPLLFEPKSIKVFYITITQRKQIVDKIIKKDWRTSEYKKEDAQRKELPTLVA